MSSNSTQSLSSERYENWLKRLSPSCLGMQIIIVSTKGMFVLLDNLSLKDGNNAKASIFKTFPP